MIRGLFLAILGATFLPGPATADNMLSSLYIGAAGGQSTFWDVDLDGGGELEFDILGFFFSGNIGFHLLPNVRVQAEWLFESTEIDSSSIDAEVIRGTLGGYYEFRETRLFDFQDVRPYAGAGAGIANVEIGGTDENELTWHAEGGVSIPIDDKDLDFETGLRFEYIFLDEDVGFDSSLWITQLRVGVRYYF